MKVTKFLTSLPFFLYICFNFFFLFRFVLFCSVCFFKKLISYFKIHFYFLNTWNEKGMECFYLGTDITLKSKTRQEKFADKREN